MRQTAKTAAPDQIPGCDTASTDRSRFPRPVRVSDDGPGELGRELTGRDDDVRADGAVERSRRGRILRRRISKAVLDDEKLARAESRSRGLVSGLKRPGRLVAAGAYSDASTARTAPAPVEVAPGLRLSPATRRWWRLLTGTPWQWLLFAADVVVLVIAVALAVSLDEARAGGAAGSDLGAVAWLYPAPVFAVLWSRGMYGCRSWRSMIDVLAGVVAAASVGMVALVATAAFAGLEHNTPLALRLWLFAAVGVCLGRVTLLLVQRHARRAGHAGVRALVVGAGEIGSRVVRGLRAHPEYGVLPVGMLDVQPLHRDLEGEVPVLGPPDDIVQVAREMHVKHVILAFSSVPDHELLVQVHRCQDAGLSVSLVPRLFESLNERVTVSHVGALPIVTLDRIDPRGWQFRVKYVMDKLIAAVALIVMLPLLLLIAAAVKLTSPGPVLFRQRRVGLDGHAFDLLKFRSMYVSPPVQESYVPHSGLAPGGIEGADRRTPVGRVLRRTFLDELPQLVNVFRGDMSLVGPRPERPEFVDLFGPQVRRYRDRHRAKAGLTGWAQVHGLRGQTPLADRIEYDNYYIDNWSLGLDLKIMLLTVVAVVTNTTD